MYAYMYKRKKKGKNSENSFVLNRKFIDIVMQLKYLIDIDAGKIFLATDLNILC